MTDIRPRDIKNLPEYSENPFVEVMGHVSKSKRTEVLYDGKRAVVNTETGEIEDRLAIARIRWVEADQFIKVYTANVSVFFDLSKPAQRVCEFLIHELGEGHSINRDRVMLYYEDYITLLKRRKIANGQSLSTFKRGVRELADKGLIAKADRAFQWFINPAVIFNGDRARFITEVRKKKKTQADIDEETGQTQLPLLG